MLKNPCKTLGFKKNMVYKIPPGGEVNHIQPVAYDELLNDTPNWMYQFSVMTPWWKDLMLHHLADATIRNYNCHLLEDGNIRSFGLEIN